MSEQAYIKVPFTLAEVPHHYGPEVHLLADPAAWSLLAERGRPETEQPRFGLLLTRIYLVLLYAAINRELPRAQVRIPTRMQAKHPGACYQGEIIDQEQSVVVVDLARAGMAPSEICFQELCWLMKPARIRQDHIMISRQLDQAGQVTGAGMHSVKIGGPVEGRWLFLPDPMGATGSTMVTVLDHYRDRVGGRPRGIIALHLVVTPEYLAAMRRAYPEVHIYALRLDRGLSAPDVLETPLGSRWAEEKGLDEHHYIVPGAGGIGEVANNAYV